MLTLVYKDIVCQKKNLWLIVAYTAFMHFAFISLPDLNAYVAGAAAVTYIFVLGQCAVEEKSKSDILINSLPVSRETIVKAKYLTGCVFMLLGLVASTLVGAIIHYLGFARSLVDLQITLGMVIASVFLWSMFYPVYFKFGYLKARYYNLFVFLLIIFASGFLVDMFNRIIEKSALPDVLTGLSQLVGHHDLMLAIALLIVSFLFSLVSLAISLRVYRGREFA